MKLNAFVSTLTDVNGERTFVLRADTISPRKKTEKTSLAISHAFESLGGLANFQILLVQVTVVVVLDSQAISVLYPGAVNIINYLGLSGY
ncbi:hypothetical protein BV898_16573 [Hypsibius exemplaris]|uniref:Uncharacterized protein n=1 Tax=Hypsibius exemplaris TaxID=2072580 RepID=A0A9X6NG44_HYPEX|nr:hypothetical protein BV898_16573 [Hypsibius exemplaris]